MDLNSEAVADLDNSETIDQDIIGDSKVGPEVTEQMSTTAPEVKTMDPTEDAIVEAVTAKDDIDNTSENVEHLKGMEEEMLSQDSISKHDATSIDNALEGELTNRVGLEEFTTHRSKTNFQFTAKLLRSKIVALEEQYCDSSASFISKNLSSCSRTLEMLKESAVDDALDELLATKNRFENFTSLLSQNSNMNMPYEDGFINITKTDILDLEPRKLNLRDSKVETVSEDITQLDSSISNIKTVLASTTIRATIHSHLDDTEAAGLCAMNPNVGKFASEPVTIQTLADLFNSHVTVEFLESFNDLIDSKLKLINKISEEPLEGKSYDDLVTFNKSYSQDITRLLTIELPFMRQWLQTIRQLSFYSREIFTVLEKY